MLRAADGDTPSLPKRGLFHSLLEVDRIWGNPLR
jgi:hypothetical protein